jgi:hypothetical protein
LPQKPSVDLAGRGFPVAYVDASAALPEVLEVDGDVAWGAVLAGVASFDAGVLCAIAGNPNADAKMIAAMLPGVAMVLSTISLSALITTLDREPVLILLLLDMLYCKWWAKGDAFIKI